MDHDLMHDAEDTISLSNLQLEDDNIIGLEQVSKTNQKSPSPSPSPSSSSTTSSFDQDFLGFFSSTSSYDNTSPENIIFCGKIVSSKSVKKAEMSSQTPPLFRSTSDSFRLMKHHVSRQTVSTPRSKSVPNRLPSSLTTCKSKWKVFMFGFGSGKFPTTMDMSDIKGRQLRRQSDDSGGWISGKKGWWRLVDVLGCGGGYERDTMVVI